MSIPRGFHRGSTRGLRYSLAIGGSLRFHRSGRHSFAAGLPVAIRGSDSNLGHHVGLLNELCRYRCLLDATITLT